MATIPSSKKGQPLEVPIVNLKPLYEMYFNSDYYGDNFRPEENRILLFIKLIEGFKVEISLSQNKIITVDSSVDDIFIHFSVPKSIGRSEYTFSEAIKSIIDTTASSLLERLVVYKGKKDTERTNDEYLYSSIEYSIKSGDTTFLASSSGRRRKLRYTNILNKDNTSMTIDETEKFIAEIIANSEVNGRYVSRKAPTPKELMKSPDFPYTKKNPEIPGPISDSLPTVNIWIRPDGDNPNDTKYSKLYKAIIDYLKSRGLIEIADSILSLDEKTKTRPEKFTNNAIVMKLLVEFILLGTHPYIEFPKWLRFETAAGAIDLRSDSETNMYVLSDKIIEIRKELFNIITNPENVDIEDPGYLPGESKGGNKRRSRKSRKIKRRANKSRKPRRR